MPSSKPLIAVIGTKTIVQVFQAIGYACFTDTQRDAIIQRCEQLTKDGYQIILILEQQAALIPDYLERRADIPYPIFLPIPDTVSKSHYGQQCLAKNLAKATGQNLGGKR